MELSLTSGFNTAFKGTSCTFFFKKNENEQNLLKHEDKKEENFDSSRKLKTEFENTIKLNLFGLRKVFSIEKVELSEYLLLEHIDGFKLSDFYQLFPNNLEKFFEYAIKTLEIVEQIHKKKFVHRKLSGDHILIDRKTNQIKIINLSASVFIGSQGIVYAQPDLIEADITHMAPEQTGRLRRRIDYRTDIYNLGVTFYHMLTGKLPFPNTNLGELIHAHIAKEPVPISRLNSQIPPILDEIIEKMMQKDSNLRYQTVYGILTDLQECQNRWNVAKLIPSFVLGKEDFNNQLVIPDKLYGRESETKTVKDIFDHMVTGNNSILMISGYSGVGKTSLIHQLRSCVFEKRGFYLEGKFNQFQRNVPYWAWYQAFRDFANQLLALDLDEVEIWKQTLKEAVGENGKVLTDAVPDLKLIIGEPADIPELSSAESQNRFNTVLKNFISAIAAETHPLVVFLDDLQWIDNASLNLLKQLLFETNKGYFLLTGAYRDNETDQNHPLFKEFQSLKKNFKNYHTIHLSNLSLKSVNSMIAESLHCNEADCLSLAKIVLDKTGGNAFFVHQMLHSFDEMGILNYNTMERKWQWDNETLKTIQITDNIVELMVDKIQKLPKKAQQVIEYASCFGNLFEQSVLSIITQQSTSDLPDNLDILVGEGLLLPLKEKFKFAHDRIQQAAYSIISASEQKRIHRDIGLLMLNKINAEVRDEFIFNIANQINLGCQENTEISENIEFAKLNFEAGQKAKNNAAYVAALEYFEAGILYLSDKDWIDNYLLILGLYTDAIDSAYMCGKYDTMNKLVEVVNACVLNEIDKVLVYETQIKALAAQGKLLDAIHSGLESLNKLGFGFPYEPEWDYVWQRFGAALSRLNEIGLEGLKNLPLMESQEKLAYTRILSALGEPAYAAAPNVFILWASEYALISFEYKHAAMSPFGYAAFALALCATGQYIDLGYQLAKIAVNLVEPFEARSSRCRVLNIYGGTIQFWKEPIRNTFSIMEQGIVAGMENGDHTSGSYAAFGMSMNLLASGEILSQIESRLIQNLETIKYFRQDFICYMVTGFLEALRTLRGTKLTEYPLEQFNRDESLLEARRINNVGGLGIYYISKLMTDFILERNETIKDSLQNAKEFAQGFQGTICTAELNFYDSLVYLRFCEPFTEIPQNLQENQTKLQALATEAPCNFQHKYDLVEAEIARCLGQNWEATIFYQKAILGARENLYFQVEALANELAAYFFKSQGFNDQAAYFIRNSFDIYSCWEAAAKNTQLLVKFPEWLADKKVKQAPNSIAADNIDIESIMRASHAISGEIEMAGLLAELMEILVQNAGAQIGYLILKTDNIWEIAATYSVINKTDLSKIRVDEQSFVSKGIINLVIRSQQPVLLNDALNEGNYRNDSVLISQKSRSLLCMPLTIRGSLSGLLYFENKLTPYAFTENRIRVLEMLATQTAISLENATYFSKLQQLNKSLEAEVDERNRTAEILKENDKLLKQQNEEYLSLNEELSESNVRIQIINEALLKAKLEAEEIGNKYRLLADNSNDIISRHSLDNLTYLYVSPSSKTFLGFEPEEMVGKSALDFIHPDDHSPIFEGMKMLGKERDWVVVIFRKLCKDGTYLWVESNSKLVKDALTGEPVEILSASRDITERKQSEELAEMQDVILKEQNEEYLLLNEELSKSNLQIQSINNELLTAKYKAEESDRLKSAFLANMSHEIRTPMNGILGFAELLKKSDLTGEQQNKYIGIINQSGQRMLAIINDLVDMSKIEAGIVEIKNESVSPTIILKGLYDFFLLEATNKGIQLLCDLPKTDIIIIETDKTKLNQILTNIIKNAIKFTNSGDVEIGYTITNKFVEFYIKDSGIGIDNVQQVLIFERFRQVDNSLNKPYEGAGLGLSISKGYAEILGGNIRVESEIGKGSTFFVTIPYKVIPEILTEEVILGNPILTLSKKVKILIVDDEEMNVYYIQEILLKENVEIISAENGLVAIDRVNMHPDIDIVLMDIKMPVMSGDEALIQIKAIRPNLPIIAQTAYSLVNDRELLLKKGFDDYLSKPISVHDILETVKKYVRK